MISLPEIIDMLIMSAAVGYIFMDIFKKPMDSYEPLRYYKGFNWNNFLFALMVVAPAIILHELSHKVVALSFGMQATFQAAYFFLGIGLLMKLLNFGFIFFVPAYVSIMGHGTPLEFSIIAFAGPAMNLAIWLFALYILKNVKIKNKYLPFIYLTKQVNMFLFIFNMIPIPGFDGFKFFSGLMQLI